MKMKEIGMNIGDVCVACFLGLAEECSIWLVNITTVNLGSFTTFFFAAASAKEFYLFVVHVHFSLT